MAIAQELLTTVTMVTPTKKWKETWSMTMYFLWLKNDQYVLALIVNIHELHVCMFMSLAVGPSYIDICIFWHLHIIQIWTCDEGNMEFYGSEATIFTSALPRSIFLLKIH